MRLVIACLFAASFAISFFAILLIRPLARRIGFVDKPGGRKIHANPRPLGGGVAIFAGIALPLLAALIYVHLFDPPTGNGSLPWQAYWGGIRLKTPMALSILGAAACLHIMGLFDDRRALGPYLKLIVQLTVITTLVWSQHLLVLTAIDKQIGLGQLPSIILSVLWIVAITNAFNFLDNMDGLSAGIAVVCATAFLIATLGIGQWFVAAALTLLIGSGVGFLCFNFPPATIFMGDSGSLVLGFFLGTLTVLATFLPAGVDLPNRWWSVFAPVIVLALPLYDLVVVSIIRINRGKSPLVGDTNHFSHRLVNRGMSRRTAVLCLYLVTATTAIAAIILPEVRSTRVAMFLFAQVLLTLGLVALLEQHPLPVNDANP